MPALRKLYILTGHSGEYDDARSWPVACYRDKAAAEADIPVALKQAKAWSRRASALRRKHDREVNRLYPLARKEQWDQATFTAKYMELREKQQQEEIDDKARICTVDPDLEYDRSLEYAVSEIEVR